MTTFIDYITHEKIGIYCGEINRLLEKLEIDGKEYWIEERSILRLKTNKGQYCCGDHPLNVLDETIKLREV